MYPIRSILARHGSLRYVAAVLLAVAAQVARIPIDPPTRIPYITYVPFVLLSAWFGGTLPGLLTGVLCLVEVAYFALEPVGALRVSDPQDYLGMAAMAVSAVLISVLVGKLHRTAARLSARTAELQRSNDDLQAYAYSVSHDLQEPLRNVSISVDLLNRKCASCTTDDPERQRIREIIATGARRMSDMLSGLLLYSRATNDDDARQWIDTGEIAGRVAALLQAKIETAGATVETRKLPRVYAWPGGLDQVFQNLIGNALKYRAEDRAPHLTISCDAGGPEWTFCFSDNGIGFDERYAEQIFGVFKRLHAQGTYEGTGIGLAIVKRIVDRHGGRAWARSKPGQGSSFFFTIPKPRRGS